MRALHGNRWYNVLCGRITFVQPLGVKSYDTQTLGLRGPCHEQVQLVGPRSAKRPNSRQARAHAIGGTLSYVVELHLAEVPAERVKVEGDARDRDASEEVRRCDRKRRKAGRGSAPRRGATDHPGVELRPATRGAVRRSGRTGLNSTFLIRKSIRAELGFLNRAICTAARC